MKKNIILKSALALIVVSSCELLGIDNPDKKEGEILIAFDKENYMSTKSSVKSLPDTNKFILKITKSDGEEIFSGEYGSAPVSVPASPGTYTIEVSSNEFNKPEWECPVYGDSQTVKVQSSQTASVLLLCHQMNAGIRLMISSKFLTSYPNSSLFLKSDDGKLLYSYTEKRFAFFKSGEVALVMSTGSEDKSLLKRTPAPSEMLTINVNVSENGKSASSDASDSRKQISIKIDSSRNWTSIEYTIGSDSESGSSESPYGISGLEDHIGEKNVWVRGYIVGGDLTSTGASFKAPFSSRSNIVLGPKSSVSDRKYCISVQLVKGEIRNELNLVDNPDNLGKMVSLCGKVVSPYYNLTGLQDLSAYRFE